MLKVQLFNATVGSIVLENDPDGINELEQIMKRSKSSDGVFYEVSMDFEFFKEAYDFIQTVYEQGQGIEEIIIVNLYEYDPNNRKWLIYNTGKLALKRYTATETRIKTSIEQSGFETKVQNLADTDVDIDTIFSQGGIPIPATPFQTIPFHAKKILKQYSAKPSPEMSVLFQPAVVTLSIDSDVGQSTRDRNAVVYVQVDNSVESLSELETTYNTPTGFTEMGFLLDRHPGNLAKYTGLFNDNAYKSTRNPVYVATEDGVANISVSIRAKASFWADNTGGDVDIVHPCESSGALAGTEVFAWFEHRDAADNVLLVEEIGQWASGCGGDEMIGVFEKKTLSKLNHSIAIGDKIFVFMTYRIFGGYEPSALTDAEIIHDMQIDIDPAETFITISNSTEFAETEHRSYLVYECLNKLAQWMTDQPVAFKSDFFGRTDSDPVYDADGEGSLLALINGRLLRQMAERRMFHNWNDLFSSLSARYCLGWGIETDPDTGAQYIRVEPKSYFWNKDSMIIDLGPVSDLEKSVSMEHYYSQVEFGFPKLDIQQLNGLDEFNTLRRHRTPITQTNSKLNIASKIKGSGFEIETQRRLQGSTKDSKLDDANFFVSVVRDGLGFRTKKNDGYTVIENLYDPETAYNLDLRPGKMIRAWGPVLASNTMKLSNKKLAFSYGDGNYNLVAQGADDAAAINESGDVDLSDVVPLWVPETYKFTAPLNRDKMRIIRANRYGYIRFSDTNGDKKDGFVLEVRHDPNKNIGEFTLLRVFRELPTD